MSAGWVEAEDPGRLIWEPGLLTKRPTVNGQQRSEPLTDPEDSAGTTSADRRMVRGGSFIHDAPDTVPAVWGAGSDVLMSEGEPLIVTGPTGVGKTTLGAQVIHARLGYSSHVLGYPVATTGGRVLYLACDRPAQIARALRRHFRDIPRGDLDERLRVWTGPPMYDLARRPDHLLELANRAGADTVVIDSLKDVAVKLSDEETGQGLNRAMQLCVANGVEVLVYHHQVKRGPGGQGKPNSLADVYGSAWITAGAGSVLLLWGAAGDPIVELSHLKQPAETVGPMRVIHDHEAGRSEVWHGVDPLALLRVAPRSASEVAAALYGGQTDDTTVQKARRKLEKYVRDGLAVRLDGLARGGSGGGSEGTRYAARATDEATDTPPLAPPDRPTVKRPTLTRVSAGQATDAATDATDAVATDVHPPLYKEGGDGSAGGDPLSTTSSSVASH